MNSTLHPAARQFDDLPGSALIPISAAMSLLSVSRSTMYRLFTAGALVPVKVGGATKLKVSELRRLIAGEVQSC